MGLFIQNSAGLLGTGSVSALSAGLDVTLIANGDTGVGMSAVMGRPELEQVTYGVQTDMGIPPTRLFQLVNTDFGFNADNIDIIILACGAGFALNNGLLVTAVGGTSIPPGFMAGSVNLNPTTSVVALYDTTQNGGDGLCVKPQNSADLNLTLPTSVVLYHELSHSLRQASNTTLDSTETDCNSASAEESAAATDENDMRDQLIVSGGGVPGPGTRRDTGNHCGTVCGGTVCCIVASIASGSPYSSEVQSLRTLRDYFLRRSTVGLDFFEHLHHDYYDFSPEVCRLMAQCPETRALVETWFVRPLVLCLNLIRTYQLDGCDARHLGESFLAGVEATPHLASLDDQQLREGVEMLRGRGDRVPVQRIADLLTTRAKPSAYIGWALTEPLEIYAGALEARLAGRTAEEIGSGIIEGIGRWGGRMPITEAWTDLSNRGFREELQFLEKALLKSPEAKLEFASRLMASAASDQNRRRILMDAGFVKEGEL